MFTKLTVLNHESTAQGPAEQLSFQPGTDPPLLGCSTSGQALLSLPQGELSSHEVHLGFSMAEGVNSPLPATLSSQLRV